MECNDATATSFSMLLAYRAICARCLFIFDSNEHRLHIPFIPRKILQKHHLLSNVLTFFWSEPVVFIGRLIGNMLAVLAVVAGSVEIFGPFLVDLDLLPLLQMICEQLVARLIQGR